MCEKLKPCPFCGSKEIAEEGDGQRQWFECQGCLATAGQCGDDEPLDRTAWNKRAELQTLTVESKDLKAEVERLKRVINCSSMDYIRKLEARITELEAALENIVNPGFGDSLYPMDMVNIAKQTLKERK